jgi:hypothetical protein
MKFDFLYLFASLLALNAYASNGAAPTLSLIYTTAKVMQGDL